MFRTLTTPAPGCDDAEVRLRALAATAPLPLYRALASSPRGLTETEATERTGSAGADRAVTAPGPARARAALTALASPFVVLLSVLCGVFAVVGDLRGVLTVAAMVVLSAVLRFWQYTRSDRAVRALRSRVLSTATVRRRADDASAPVHREVPVQDVVRGDIVVLAPGDVVPADVRLVSAANLLVDQSGLTGETLPVGKDAATVHRPKGPGPRRARPQPVELPALCFAGTSVVGGSGTGVVVATGADTYFGTVTAKAAGRGESSFDRGVRAVGWTLVRFMLVMVPIVLVVRGLVSGDWARAAMFALAVAVGLTPEMLPVIVTTNLVRGATRLAARRVIVTRLDAIQDLGAIDVLCVDKTGTLTEDRVAYAHSVDAAGHPDGEAAEYAHLAAHFQDVAHNHLDEAIAAQLSEDGDDVLTEAMFDKAGELGFDYERRRSTVVVHRAGEHIVISKGDPDRVLPRCAHARRGGAITALTDAQRRDVAELARAYARSGMRVLAVAARAYPAPVRDIDGAERDLVLVGFVGFVDPVRAGAADAVRALRDHGVAVLMLTGDNPTVAAQVAARAGMPVGEVVTGHQIRTADEARLRGMVGEHTVFAALTPEQKARIVAVLRAEGHAVGVVGDGVNDAMALRAADVGVSVDTATEVAKDAADLILTERDLGVLARGVVEGRRTLANTLKYVRITASSNFGNVLTVLAASVFLPVLPILPVQLMVQNLLYDTAQLTLPWDRVDRDYLRAPRRWDAAGLARFMLVFGPVSSLFDLATFAVLWWPLGAAAHQDLFHTGWFVEGLCSQLLVVLLLRGRGGTRPARGVLVAAGAVALAGILLPLSPLAGPLRLVALPPGYFPWLAAILAGYALTTVAVKRLWLRHVG